MADQNNETTVNEQNSPQVEQQQAQAQAAQGEQSQTSSTQSATTQGATSVTTEAKKNDGWNGIEDVPLDGDDYGGDDLSDVYAQLDQNIDSYVDMSNGQRLKISLFFVPKFYSIQEIKDKKGVCYLTYKQDVDYIQILDRLDNFGYKAVVNLHSDGSKYDDILQRFNCYHFVINLTILSDNDSIKLEPMIFDIDQVEEVKNNKQSQHVQTFQLQMSDLFTYILKHHSIASVVKMNPDIVRASSYKEIFKSVLDYVKRYVFLNTALDGKYEKFARFCFEYSDLGSCVEATFAKIKQDASILEALQFILNECGTAISTPSDFSEVYATFGDVCLPFFFREEYPDAKNLYLRLWGGEDETESEGESDARDLVDTSSSFGTAYVRRDFTMRDMYMPFGLAFKNDNKIIFESFNPSIIKRQTNNGEEVEEYTNEELQYSCINGRTKSQIYDFRERHPDMSFLYKKFKNMIFVSSGDETYESVLIYLEWLFQWYVQIMLNGYNNGGLVSKLVPDFLLIQKNLKITKKFKRPFEESNASVYMLRSEDPVNETLIVMGRIIASLVFMSTLYSFKVSGNIFRRPNEIIKLGRNNVLDIESNVVNNFNTGLNVNNYTLLYVTSVTHTFSQGQYDNRIVGTVIYENT